MNAFQAAINAAQDTLRAIHGEPVIYRRGDDALEILAVPGSTKFRVDTDESANVQHRSHDWLIRATDLATLDPPRPVEHDLIERTVGDTVETYQLLPVPGEPCYRYSDHAGRTLRCHTKLIDRQPVEPADDD